MATPIVTLKSWFETGKKPTETQFAALIDAFRHKDIAIAQSDISGLVSALAGKLATSKVVSNSESNNTTEVFSTAAVQNLIGDLQASITAINTLLATDDLSLDELQEVVDFIKANREDLQNLSIENIAGLVDALALKVDAVAGKGLSTNDFTDDDKQNLTNNTKNIQREITSDLVLTSNDFKTTFIVNATGNITITMPVAGLQEGFICFFIVIGSGNVTINAADETLTFIAPNGNILSNGKRGLVERRTNTSTYMLSGEFE